MMDKRLRDHLIERMSSFGGTLRELGWVIADLDGVWSSESDWPGEQRRAFRREWGALEQIYAGALDREPQHLDEDDQRDIRSTLDMLLTMLPPAAEPTD